MMTLKRDLQTQILHILMITSNLKKNKKMENFDCTFVLNLERRTDRMERVTDILHYLNISFERYIATDSEVIAGLHKNLLHLNPDSTMSRPGYLACLLSHLSMFKTALDRGYKSILVLEDDVFIHKDVKQWTQTIMSQVPDNWDMIYFGYLPLSDDLQFWSHDHFALLKEGGNVFRSKGLWCTHAYAIKADFMKETLQYFNTTSVDLWTEIDRHFVTQQEKHFYEHKIENENEKKNSDESESGGEKGTENQKVRRNIYACTPSVYGQVASHSDLSNGFFTLENEKKFINSNLTPRSDFL